MRALASIQVGNAHGSWVLEDLDVALETRETERVDLPSHEVVDHH